jgi:hypothetical protein
MIPSTKHILLATFFLGLLSCGQPDKGSINISNAKIEDTYKPCYTAAEFNDKLEFNFKQARPDSFEQLFIDWNRTIKPNSEDFIHQNDTIHVVFDVYKAFYKPLDLLKLGDWEWGNKLNSKCRYVVVQNKLFYSILLTDNFDDFDWKKSRKDSIENFRPPIDLDRNKVLYLTNEYATSINKFLGAESTKLGEGNIMNPSRPAGESEKRYEVLRSFIPILHGHWGGYWHLETHPHVSVIIFNKTLTKAQIHFRVGYQGGEAILEKTGNEWTIKESKATWIE